MTAFLLIWSPKKWPWPELPDVAKRVAAGVAVADVWGCGFARSILPGDRVFLHRVAQEPKGIFGSGYVTRAPYEVPDPATKRGYRLCIDFVYDRLVDAHEGVVIPREMLRTHPDLAALLFDPIATDRRGEVPEGEKPYLEIPVLSWHAGFMTGFYQRQYIDSAQRFPDAPRLTPARVQALDLFDKLANDPGLHLGMQLQPGDMQFVYNHALLHDRTAFRDWPDASQKRHLFRLWLSMEGDRPLPDCFKQRYGSIEIGNRGGIITKATNLNVSLA